MTFLLLLWTVPLILLLAGLGNPMPLSGLEQQPGAGSPAVFDPRDLSGY